MRKGYTINELLFTIFGLGSVLLTIGLFYVVIHYAAKYW